MGIGASVFLIAAGAIMSFAVETDSSNGFNINNAGVILMVIGLLGLLVSLFVFAPRRTRQTLVEEGPNTRRQVTRDDVV